MVVHKVWKNKKGKAHYLKKFLLDNSVTYLADYTAVRHVSRNESLAQFLRHTIKTILTERTSVCCLRHYSVMDKHFCCTVLLEKTLPTSLR